MNGQKLDAKEKFGVLEMEIYFNLDSLNFFSVSRVCHHQICWLTNEKAKLTRRCTCEWLETNHKKCCASHEIQHFQEIFSRLDGESKTSTHTHSHIVPIHTGKRCRASFAPCTFTTWWEINHRIKSIPNHFAFSPALCYIQSNEHRKKRGLYVWSLGGGVTHD